jgi:hypothetical protein
MDYKAAESQEHGENGAPNLRRGRNPVRKRVVDDADDDLEEGREHLLLLEDPQQALDAMREGYPRVLTLIKLDGEHYVVLLQCINSVREIVGKACEKLVVS